MTAFSARLPAAGLTSVSMPTAKSREARRQAADLAAGSEDRLLRQDPLDHVLDLGRVLARDGLVFFLRAVHLDLGTLGHEFRQLGFTVGLALVLGGDLLVGRALLVLVH